MAEPPGGLGLKIMFLNTFLDKIDVRNGFRVSFCSGLHISDVRDHVLDVEKVYCSDVYPGGLYLFADL